VNAFVAGIAFDPSGTRHAHPSQPHRRGHAAGREAARQALHYVAPVGEKDAWVNHALKVVGDQLGDSATP
jgi:hypothetical protein